MLQQISTEALLLVAVTFKLPFPSPCCQVGTAGDCMIVAGGIMTTDENGFQVVDANTNPVLACRRVFDFAVELLQRCATIPTPHGDPVRMRVGLHTVSGGRLGCCSSACVTAPPPARVSSSSAFLTLPRHCACRAPASADW